MTLHIQATVKPYSHNLEPGCRADADLKLLGSRKLPKDAFKDKIVWITGASQVCAEPLATRHSHPSAFQC